MLGEVSEGMELVIVAIPIFVTLAIIYFIQFWIEDEDLYE